MTYRSLLLLVFAFGTTSLWSQKVNYKKDLYPLLSAGQYDQAEPMLRRFVKSVIKEDDSHPNAFMFMGFMLQGRFMATDVLKEPQRAAALGDTAVYYLDLCLKGLDEKELKRRDEFYQNFVGLDLRTGQTGLSLEKIRYDLNKKIQDIKDRKQKMDRLNRFFNTSVGVYQKNIEQFKSITAGYASYNQFLLKADEATLTALRRIKERADSVESVFRLYKSVNTQMGSTGYNQELSLVEIKSIATDGISPADFYAPQISLWNFRAFADESIRSIEQDIMPLNENLLRMDMDLNRLLSKIKNDSVAVFDEIAGIADQVRNNRLVNYDPDPFPLAVFRVKIAELQFGSEQAAGRAEKSSGNLIIRKNRLEREARALRVMDSLVTLVLNRDLQAEAQSYERFVRDTYSGLSYLKLMLETNKDFAMRKRMALTSEINTLSESLKYLDDAGTKIPALPGVTVDGFYPLVLVQESHTAGLKYKNGFKPKGYFYLISPSRKAEVKAEVPLDSTLYSIQQASLVKARVVEAQAGQIYYPVFYSEQRVNGKIQLTIAKVYTLDGLAWSNPYLVDGIPSAINFIKETGDLSMTIETTNGPTVVTILKDGKMQ